MPTASAVSETGSAPGCRWYADAIRLAESLEGETNDKGMYVALWAAWGSMVHDGPEVLDPSNAHAYAEFLGERYAEKDVIFVLDPSRAAGR